MFAGSGALVQGAYVIFGLLGSRMLTNVVLQTNNTGVMGYGGNLIASLLLGWGAKKFVSHDAGKMITIGGIAGLIARLVTDLTPVGKFVNMQLSGMDGGVGALMPSSFVDPALFTGDGATRRIPSAWAPPATSLRGLGASSYKTSTYGGWVR